MPEGETSSRPADSPSDPKPALGAIVTGVLVAILGFIAATAQGMATAPSHFAANVALGLMLAGCLLALCGLGSIWLPRLRKPARMANLVTLALIALAFVADKAMAAFG